MLPQNVEMEARETEVGEKLPTVGAAVALALPEGSSYIIGGQVYSSTRRMNGCSRTHKSSALFVKLILE